MIYLAVPYSHADPAVRVARFDAVNKVAAKMMRDGLHVFSPISHTHPIALAGDLPGGWEYWEAYDRALIKVYLRPPQPIWYPHWSLTPIEKAEAFLKTIGKWIEEPRA